MKTRLEQSWFRKTSLLLQHKPLAMSFLGNETRVLYYPKDRNIIPSDREIVLIDYSEKGRHLFWITIGDGKRPAHKLPIDLIGSSVATNSERFLIENLLYDKNIADLNETILNIAMWFNLRFQSDDNFYLSNREVRHILSQVIRVRNLFYNYEFPGKIDDKQETYHWIRKFVYDLHNFRYILPEDISKELMGLYSTIEDYEKQKRRT